MQSLNEALPNQEESAIFNVVLWEPEIPPNTGNVARLSAALDLTLHLIGPIGFSISDRRVRRAGLDYWEAVRLVVHACRAAFETVHPEANAWYFTTKGRREFWDAPFRPGDFLVFGSETRGLPADLLAAHPDRCLVIPQGPAVRSLNLSNCVAIAVFEAMRQQRRNPA